MTQDILGLEAVFDSHYQNIAASVVVNGLLDVLLMFN
jgi:hypothetical protein